METVKEVPQLSPAPRGHHEGKIMSIKTCTFRGPLKKTVMLLFYYYLSPILYLHYMFIHVINEKTNSLMAS